MDEIKVGDLVQVIRAKHCCGYSADIGATFYVSRVDRLPSSCAECRVHYGTVTSVDSKDGHQVHINRVIKINPPPEQSAIETKERISA